MIYYLNDVVDIKIQNECETFHSRKKDIKGRKLNGLTFCLFMEPTSILFVLNTRNIQLITLNVKAKTPNVRSKASPLQNF